MNTIILTGGGTAGHVTPALALIPEIKQHFDKIVYIGSKNGIEKDLAKAQGLDYYYVPTVKLERKLTFKKQQKMNILFKTECSFFDFTININF